MSKRIECLAWAIHEHFADEEMEKLITRYKQIVEEQEEIKRVKEFRNYGLDI